MWLVAVAVAGTERGRWLTCRLWLWLDSSGVSFLTFGTRDSLGSHVGEGGEEEEEESQCEVRVLLPCRTGVPGEKL